MKRIILTGGGTAGHVTPNLALLPHLLTRGWEVHYIGTAIGIEHELVAGQPGVTYHVVNSGKLRRYFDLKNFTDPLRVIQGAGQAMGLIRKLRPQLVFAKGGFVSVPVVVGAALAGVPVLLHESDLTPGLANRICMPMAKKVLTTFQETAESLGDKAVYTGTPLRPELFAGSRDKGLGLCGFNGQLPVLMMMGGSLGAASVNQALRSALPDLTQDFQVLHICGKGNLDPKLQGQSRYRQFEYLKEDLPHAFAAADFLLSRAGSNSLSELLALKKPALLVPYPSSASRGDQIENAQMMAKRGLAEVLMQQDMTPQVLTQRLRALYARRGDIVARIQASPQAEGTAAVLAQMDRWAKKASV